MRDKATDSRLLLTCHSIKHQIKLGDGSHKTNAIKYFEVALIKKKTQKLKQVVLFYYKSMQGEKKVMKMMSLITVGG